MASVISKKMRVLIILCILQLLNYIHCTNTTGYCFGNACLANDYDNSVKPFSDEIMNIKLDFDITQIIAVDESDFTITFKMYFGIRWHEPRMICPLCLEEYTPLDLSFLEKIWVPDVYIYNLKRISSTRILTDFAGNYLIFQ